MSIAFICALPTGLNPGMISVDLGIKSFLDKTGLGDVHASTLFCTEQALRIEARSGQILDYKYLSDAVQLRKYDHIVYWGDFAHWIEYSQKEWTKRGINTKLIPQQAEDKWYSLYFLEDHQELINKTIVYGGTLYGLTLEQVRSKRYLSNLRSFFGRCKGSYFRDIYSVNFINQITGSVNSALSGDCAMVSHISTIGWRSSHEPNTSITKKLGIAIGRSSKPEILHQFSEHLASQLKAEKVDINWLKSRGIDGFNDCIEKLQECDYVFTDIYHCGVNSISLGIPTISTGLTSQAVNHTLSDKKKEVFFRQHLMSEYYLPTEVISHSLSNREMAARLAKKAASKMNDKNALSFAHELIQKVTIDGISKLYKSLTDGT